jgi:redox-sensitive bicupin YhaK (pirin superfamily)
MPIEQILRGRATDVGGLPVARLLPHAQRRSIGPFVFVDHFGPTVLPPGAALDVRPHPHIGLATVTYLFEGAILHRDSLGCVQRIEPGAVNWMTAGRGIVHSERTPAELRGEPVPMHGMQIWVALPREAEDVEPSFAHYDASALPVIERPGAVIRLIAGQAFGARSPVATFSDTLYCALELAAGAQIEIAAEHAERAVFAASGAIEIDGQAVAAGELAVLAPGRSAQLAATHAARLMLLGGAPLGERFVWWNFVASSHERIEAAKAEWLAYERGSARFPPVPGETEFIALPER